MKEKRESGFLNTFMHADCCWYPAKSSVAKSSEIGLNEQRIGRSFINLVISQVFRSTFYISLTLP